MNGLMMETPLLVSSLIRHADRHHGRAEVVSRRVEGDIHRYTYRDSHVRMRKLANALKRLGAKPGERIATLAWNGYRHFELCYAIEFSQAVRKLRDRFEGSYDVFFERLAASDHFSFDEFAAPLEAYGYAACYSPDPDNPGKALLPFELESGSSPSLQACRNTVSPSSNSM